MKIINDTEVFEPSECYFAISRNPDCTDEETTVSITSIEFWDENKCLSDTFGDHSLSDEVQSVLEDEEICCVTDATWSSNASVQSVRATMLKLGFVECEEMKELLERE